MEWRDEAAADLPEPQAGDPPKLRRDILDELADHLACAADRERLRGGDDAEVAGRVRDRFGDPARIARQLWLDAVKEKLMAQRITIAVAVVLGLAAVVACGVLWSSVRQTRELLADALAQNRAQTEQNAQTNAALLARIEELSKSADQMSSFAMEWNPIRLRLVKGENGTEPAVGYRGTLTGGVYERDGMTRFSDENGILDFGHFQPGHYTVMIWTPWEAYRTYRFEITPGTKIDRTIACPAEDVVDTDVRLEVEWPEDLPEEIDKVVVTVSDPVQPFADDRWLLPSSVSEPNFVIQRDGTANRTFVEIRSAASFPRGFERDVPGVLTPFAATGIRPFNWRSGPSPQRVERPPMDWRTAQYSLSRIALIWSDINIMEAESASSRFAGRFPYSEFVGIVSLATSEERRGAGELPLDQPQSITPAPDQRNVWRITLPAEMIQQARERVEKFQRVRRERPVEAPRPPDPRFAEFERRLRERGGFGFEPRSAGFGRD